MSSSNEDIQPYQSPKMDIKKLDENGIEIVLEIPSTPEFTLGEYKGLELKRDVKAVTDAEVQQAIDRELMRGSRLVETGKPVKNDDTVTLDFEGFVDGKAFEGGKAEKYQLKIGSHSFGMPVHEHQPRRPVRLSRVVGVAPGQLRGVRQASLPGIVEIESQSRDG